MPPLMELLPRACGMEQMIRHQAEQLSCLSDASVIPAEPKQCWHCSQWSITCGMLAQDWIVT
jgi:hypothetical protein